MLLTRGPLRSARMLAGLDASGSFLGCASAALPLLLAGATVDHQYRMLLVITNALIARSAVMPTPAGWTLRVSMLAALPACLFT